MKQDIRLPRLIGTASFTVNDLIKSQGNGKEFKIVNGNVTIRITVRWESTLIDSIRYSFLITDENEKFCNKLKLIK